MAFAISPAYETAILRQYEKNIARYPVIREDVETFLAEKDWGNTNCFLAVL